MDLVPVYVYSNCRILGYRGNVPDEVVELCEGCDLRATVSAAYQLALAHLGQYSGRIEKLTLVFPKLCLGNGLRRYYNRIGQIIWKMVRLKIDFVKRVLRMAILTS